MLVILSQFEILFQEQENMINLPAISSSFPTQVSAPVAAGIGKCISIDGGVGFECWTSRHPEIHAQEIERHLNQDAIAKEFCVWVA